MSAEQVNNKTRLSVTHVDCGHFFQHLQCIHHVYMGRNSDRHSLN